MAFNKTNIVSNIKKGDLVINIYRFIKDGTKRVFYAPEINGKRITTTMFARMYDAEKLAKHYIEYKTNLSTQ